MNYLKSIDNNQDGINKVNMEYLQQKHNAKVRVKTELYNKILNRCYNRIDIASDSGDQYCFYYIPEYIYGFPTFNIKSCAAYVMKKLIGNGFHVKFFHPNLIYIYWFYRSSPNCITPLMNAPFRQELTYPDSFTNEPRQTSLHALPAPIPEPKPEISIPMKRTGQNIPLPPINFEYCSGQEIRDLLPPHKSQVPTKKVIDIPVRETSPFSANDRQLPARDTSPFGNDRQLQPAFEISLTEKPMPTKRSSKQNYRSIEEDRTSKSFLYHR